MAARTDKSARKLLGLLLCLFAFSCSRTGSAERSYREAWSAYVAGDLTRAAALASDGEARWRSSRNLPAYWRLRFLLAETLTAQSNRRAAEALLQEAVPAGAGLSQLEGRRLMDLALASFQSNNRTPDFITRAHALVADADLRIRLSIIEASIAFNQGHTAAATAAAQSAEQIAEEQKDVYWEAQALNALSACAKSRHDYEESIAFGQRALEAANRVGARRTAAFAHGNLGSTYALLGNFDAALDHQQQAIRIFEAIGARANLMIARGELGLAYDSQDDYPKATENYKRAFDLARELGNDKDAARHAANLALTSIKSEKWDVAESWNNQAAELAAKSKYAYVEMLVERNRARIVRGRGHADEAAAMWRAILAANPNNPAIRWEAYYWLGVIDADQKHFPQADRSFESALRIISENRSELLDPQNRITLLSRLIQFYNTYVETLVDQNDDARALRVVESSRAKVLSERLGRELRPQQFESKASFEQAAAATHSAILSFWLAPARSFAWLITANNVWRFELPGSAEIEKLVTKYRETVEHSLRDPIAANDPAGPALWHALMEKIAPRIPKASSLIVIPDGPLHRLNLETLIQPSPKPHYWIEDVQIAVSPSITIAASKPAATAPSAPGLLVIGDPNYKGSAYEPLPNAASEIREVRSHFTGWQQAVYDRGNASPAAYAQSKPGAFSLIHFAAHAEANYERPLESSIILSQAAGHNKLLARDVTDIPIHASLVTISACRSAGTRAYAGEGLMGFAWAFLNAGARAVIAGLWDVSDTSTGQLMDRLYAGIAAGQEPAAALRNAKLSLLHGAPSFQKPFYWAPFQVYLGSAAR